MKNISWCKAFAVLVFACIIMPLPATAGQMAYAEEEYYFFEPGPVMKSQLYLDGSTVEFETGSLTYPVTGSDLSQLTPGEFRTAAMEARRTFDDASAMTVISPGRDGRGINIVFNCSSVPPAAMAALESVAVYLEQVFTDDVTVSINISFAPLGPGILGVAQSYMAGNPSWDITRSSLIADMDADDSIETWLPTGSTIPVRYDYASPTVTSENRVYFRVATYNAAIGSYPSLAAQITFSTNFTFDFDPRDGVVGHCFQSVAVHEVGHVLGFGCGTWMSQDIEVNDIYRFQRSDGAGDYNPDDWSEFQTTARMVDLSPGSDDVNSDMIAIEYQMSDGDPYQTSHFSQNNVNAIMQPAFSSGQTYYPNFLRTPDRVMFDAIGWDYLMSYYLTWSTWGNGTVETDPSAPSYAPGTSVIVTAVPDAGWEFVEWGGDLYSQQNPDTIIMDADKAIVANFQTINCTLTVSVVGNGTVIKDPDLPYYPRGSTVTLTAVPDPGWTFSFWSGNLWGSTNPATITMNGDKNVTANFTYTGIEENEQGMAGTTYFTINPNPFRQTTDIRYQIADDGMTQGQQNISIRIYDVSGSLVKDFGLPSVIGHQSSVRWDGTDDASRKLGNGVYFVRFSAGDFRQTTKLMVIR